MRALESVAVFGLLPMPPAPASNPDDFEGAPVEARRTPATGRRMRTIIAGLLSAGLLAAAPGIANAGHVRHPGSYSRQYPSATPRQLENLRAYERGGEYYETDPDAVPFGSRVWWENKGRQAR
jgi:hypothetical protein